MDEMERRVPRSRLLGRLEPHYPKGMRARPPIGLERMLRMLFARQWYALSDGGLEYTVSDSAAVQHFVGIELGHEKAHMLTAVLLVEINVRLRERGLMMREGAVVDAALINALTLTNNRDKVREPEMHPTKKCCERYHGIRAHVGADAESGSVHSTH